MLQVSGRYRGRGTAFGLGRGRQVVIDKIQSVNELINGNKGQGIFKLKKKCPTKLAEPGLYNHCSHSSNANANSSDLVALPPARPVAGRGPRENPNFVQLPVGKMLRKEQIIANNKRTGTKRRTKDGKKVVKLEVIHFNCQGMAGGRKGGRVRTCFREYFF